jgi:hypothetical protein
MTGCSDSSFLESSCSSFSLALGSMEFLIDSMPRDSTSYLHYRFTDLDGQPEIL